MSSTTSPLEPPPERSAPWRLRLFGVSSSEASFVARGFVERDPESRTQLERVGTSFVDGYRASLELGLGARLLERLQAEPAPLRGFAFEGAAFGLCLCDSLPLGRGGRWRCFAAGAGGAHLYMLHVGCGFALGRLPVGKRRALSSLDPLLRWLAFDGYGFHETYFKWGRTAPRGGGAAHPGWLRGYERRAFDQGVGRALWFVACAQPEAARAAVAEFCPERRADLWSGLGLACAYTGIGAGARAEALRAAAGEQLAPLAQGAAFAAEARVRARNQTPESDAACLILSGLPAPEAARLARAARAGLVARGDEPDYEEWRARIRARLAPTPDAR